MARQYHVTLSEAWKVVVDVHAESEAQAIRKARSDDKRGLARVFSHVLDLVEVEEDKKTTPRNLDEFRA